MLDFLRQLAPVREPDATRAVAVIPSRFTAWHPLHDLEQAASDQRPDDSDVLHFPETGALPAIDDFAAVKPGADVGVQPIRPFTVGLTRQSMQGNSEQSMSPARATDAASGAPGAPYLRAIRNRVDDHNGPVAPSNPQAANPVSAMSSALPALQHRDTSQVRAHESGPLSQASLAQRAVPSQDNDQVVHVTIGRIDVVTQPAPAPAPSRSPAPRQPSVTLAEYLHGHHRHHGGRP